MLPLVESPGALLVMDFAAFMAGGRDFKVLFRPTPTTAVLPLRSQE